MTNDILSQDEINALLQMTNDGNDSTKEEETEITYLSDIEIDTLGEIGNISLGSSATSLSTLLNQKVEITTPEVSIVKKTGIKEEYPYEHVKLQVNYVDGFDGENVFLMKATDAAIISDIMLGGDGANPNKELTEIELSAVQEAMNQMMGASATSMSSVFDKRVDISPPTIAYEEIDKLEVVEGEEEEEVYVRVMFQLKIGNLIDSSIMQIIPLEFAKVLVNQLLNPVSDSGATEQVLSEIQPEEQIDVSTEEAVEQRQNNESQMEQAHYPPMPETSQETQYVGAQTKPNANVQSASFSAFDTMEHQAAAPRNLDLLLDIPLKVTVELGRTKQTVEEILELSPGSIMELDKLAGEPVDVLVNNKLIAKGEVVVIDENFGVRITDVLSEKERLLNLKN